MQLYPASLSTCLSRLTLVSWSSTIRMRALSTSDSAIIAPAPCRRPGLMSIVECFIATSSVSMKCSTLIGLVM